MRLLKQSVQIWIPQSTQTVPVQQFVKTILARYAGGYTEQAVRGGWVDPRTGKLIEEEVAVVEGCYSVQDIESAALVALYAGIADAVLQLFDVGEQEVLVRWNNAAGETRTTLYSAANDIELLRRLVATDPRYSRDGKPELVAVVPPAEAPAPVRYTGHLPNSPIQGHSAGAYYPYVLVAKTVTESPVFPLGVYFHWQAPDGWQHGPAFGRASQAYTWADENITPKKEAA